MKDAFITDGIRTPIGSFKGSLSTMRGDDLAALVMRKLVERNPSIPANVIDDVIFGCSNQAGDDNRNVSRMSLLLAGIPWSVPGETVNRLCASGMSAVINASRAIKAGDADVLIAGGMEHMTRGPWVISKTSSAFGQDAQMYDSSFGWRFVNPKMHELYGTDPMGITAENLAEMYNISRADQDAFAYNSQMKAAAAQKSGRFAEEITPVALPQKKGDPVMFDTDEFIKGSTTVEKLGTLKPSFSKTGTVTAGNASGLNDGAAALYILSGDAVKNYNVTPKARIVSSAVVGVEPRIMGIGPVGATHKALAKAGLTLNDIDVIELNEAFAAQSLAVIRQLGLDDNDPRINPNGGAIAIGHPLGMSGARIIYSAALELHKQQKKYALATMCVGLGQGYAVIIERV
ncbi:MAG: beta-ketoadipyl CoA thiolase [Flavipsychrobacter sp.]|nr:beta-ketoadipyl CoA thiolase [Flavipsychrobacter sp.]